MTPHPVTPHPVTLHPVTLAETDPADIPLFKAELQAAFSIAVIAEYGPLPNGPIPHDDDLDHCIAAPGAVVLRIIRDGQAIGGAVLTIDRATRRNALVLFFLSAKVAGRGLGHQAWTAIERRYPDTAVWTTLTPYFEKRNIHFYVNKCGFRIVEFFGSFHPDPSHAGPSDLPGGGEAFRFEKVMPGAGVAGSPGPDG